MSSDDPIFTIGHSTHPLERFLRLLTAYDISGLADVRRFPGSRRHPHFTREALAGSLDASGIEYRHFAGLGWRRRASGESANAGWTHPSFRAYADHMATDEFAVAIAELLSFARNHRVAVMCAEAQPWRCHRQLIADALVARQVEVRHIFSESRVSPHELTPFARVDESGIHYPALF